MPDHKTYTYSATPEQHAQIERLRKNLIAREDWMLMTTGTTRADFAGAKWAGDFSKSQLIQMAFDFAALMTAPGEMTLRQKDIVLIVAASFERTFADKEFAQRYVNEWTDAECWDYIEANILKQGLVSDKVFVAAPDPTDRPATARPTGN